VDRTPFHNRWISRNLSKKLSGEVRLLKRFAKALGVYGSDTRVQGFSGYLCELLIVRYGSFEALVREAAGWEPGKVFIDVQNHHKGKLPDGLKKKFEGQPMVVIDPVDRNRNVAAAFSPANFARFILACESFMKKPSIGFFFPAPRKADLNKIRKTMLSRGSKFIMVKFQRPDVIDDVLWPQLRRTAKRLKDIMLEYDFLVLDWAVHSDFSGVGEPAKGLSSYIMLELGVWKLPRIRKVTGPPVFIRPRAAEFRKKYQKLGKVWVEDDRLVAEVKREWLDAVEKLRDSLSDPLKDLKAKGIASHVAESVARGFRLVEDDAILRSCSKDSNLALFMSEYLERSAV